jgi:hypothetical protein
MTIADLARKFAALPEMEFLRASQDGITAVWTWSGRGL